MGFPQLLGTEIAWPSLFGLTALPAVLMVLMLPMCPESPKFILINKGQDKEAEAALKWLRRSDDVTSEMDEMRAEIEATKSLPKVTLKEMRTNIMLRKPLIISVVMMLSQQFSGCNAIVFYSTDIFMNAGLSKETAVYGTLGMGSVFVVMTVISMFLVERAGRKTLHLIGLTGMMIITIILVISMALTPKFPWLSYISVICVIGFIIMFATGPGSIPWFLVAELFGQSARPTASSIAVFVNWTANFIVSIAFLPIAEAIAEYTFLLFTVALMVFCIFTYFKVPETKGKTIEEVMAQFRPKIEDIEEK